MTQNKESWCIEKWEY